jgi:hypothetical protein
LLYPNISDISIRSVIQSQFVCVAKQRIQGWRNTHATATIGTWHGAVSQKVINATTAPKPKAFIVRPNTGSYVTDDYLYVIATIRNLNLPRATKKVNFIDKRGSKHWLVNRRTHATRAWTNAAAGPRRIGHSVTSSAIGRANRNAQQ